jgi:hypothetical protein
MTAPPPGSSGTNRDSFNLGSDSIIRKEATDLVGVPNHRTMDGIPLFAST